MSQKSAGPRRLGSATGSRERFGSAEAKKLGEVKDTKGNLVIVFVAFSYRILSQLV